ncbi:MAG: acylphosphatase [Candidatus Hatepunaea meridiana]|nr:acylphosphatase [Candidatus Hatepunaea meridiana]
MTSAHILVKGLVQGVNFRWFIRREAEQLGLVGTVKNLWDERVEIVVEGERNIIEDLVKIFSIGNGISRVDSCDIKWIESKSKFNDFNIIY